MAYKTFDLEKKCPSEKHTDLKLLLHPNIQDTYFCCLSRAKAAKLCSVIGPITPQKPVDQTLSPRWDGQL